MNQYKFKYWWAPRTWTWDQSIMSRLF